MRIFGLGPTELLIVGVIMILWLVPAVLSVVGMYRIATKAGYDAGASVLWTIGYLAAGWLTVLLMGLLEWPRDRGGAPAPSDVPPQLEA